MKLLIVGDLHGQKPSVQFKGFDAIIAPGDFCPSDELREWMFKEIRERMKNPRKYKKWHDMVGKEKAKEMVERALKKGRQILEYLNSFGVPVYVIPGNGDFYADEEEKWEFLKHNHYEKLISGLENIIDIHMKSVDVGEFVIIGYGLSSHPEYPQYEEDLNALTPEKLEKKGKKYDLYSKRVSELFENAEKPVLFLSHNVPFNTPIDKITNKKSPKYGYHYGSLIARETIEKYNPLLCVGGHMHEHFNTCKIGRTVCLNTGFGAGVNTLLEIRDGKIRRLTLRGKEQ